MGGNNRETIKIACQVSITICFFIYGYISLRFKKFEGKLFRFCNFTFIIAGLIKTVGDSWFDFLALFIPIVILYQFEAQYPDVPLEDVPSKKDKSK